MWFVVETFVVVLVNFNINSLEYNDEVVCALTRMRSYSYSPKKLDLYLKIGQHPNKSVYWKATSARAEGIFESLEICGQRNFVSYYCWIFSWTTRESLVSVLRRNKRGIGWTTIDIISIPPGICTHKILLEKDRSATIKHQWRPYLVVKKMVKKKIIM